MNKVIVCMPSAHGHRKPSVREPCLIHREQLWLKLAQPVSANVMLPIDGPPPPYHSVPNPSAGDGHDLFQRPQRAAALPTSLPPCVRRGMEHGANTWRELWAVLILLSLLTFTVS